MLENEVADLGIGCTLVDWYLNAKKSAELMHLACCLGRYEYHETAVE